VWHIQHEKHVARQPFLAARPKHEDMYAWLEWNASGAE